MKNFILLPLLAITQFVFGQDPWPCVTPKPHRPSAGIASQADYISTRTDPAPLYIPIAITLIGKDDSTGFYSVANVWDAICELETDFASYNIRFFIKGNPRYIPHTLMYNMDAGFFYSDSMFNFIAFHNIQDVLNLYIIDSGNPNLTTLRDLDYDNSTYPPTIRNPQRHAIFVSKNAIGKYNHILTHEVGHYLGLWHTFVGWEGLDYDDYAGEVPDTLFWSTYDPDEDTIYYDLPWLVEYVDGSNCDIAGDLICDTPPDYLSSHWSCNANGESSKLQTDPHGDTFHSDGTNYMSYSNDGCVNQFSPLQVRWMQDVALGPRNYLLYDQSPSSPISTEQVNFIFPQDNSSIEVNDSIVLDWEDIQGATHYLVEFGRKVNSTYIPLVMDITLNESQLKVAVASDLKYYLKVKAINQYFPCQVLSDTSFFNTAPITATEEIIYQNGVTLYPNPVSETVHWNFLDGSVKSESFELHVFDAFGHQVQHSLSEGSSLNVSELTEGVYSMLMVGETETFYGKFLKQSKK